MQMLMKPFRSGTNYKRLPRQKKKVNLINLTGTGQRKIYTFCFHTTSIVVIMVAVTRSSLYFSHAALQLRFVPAYHYHLRDVAVTLSLK